MYYGPDMEGESNYAFPTGNWVFDADRNFWIFQAGVYYEYAWKTNSKWWIDMTVDRLFSERWYLDIKDWWWGIRVELFANFNTNNATGDYTNYETCFNLGLLSKEL